MTEEPSKTARKREALRLQDIGRALTQLKAQDLATFDLPNPLGLAIEEYGRINSREGGRRQLQYIGRLMRRLDTEAIELQLQHLRGESNAARHALHLVEQWRDRLLADPQTLTQLLHEHPQIDRQKLRQLLKRVTSTGAISDHESPSPAQKQAARALFRFLRVQFEISETP